MLDAEDNTHRVAGDQQLLIGGNDPDLESGIVAVDAAFASADRGRVAVTVKRNSEPFEVAADALAHGRRILADAAREDDRVGTIHRREISSDVLASAVAEEIDRQPRATIAMLRLLCQQLAHVIRQTGDAEKPRLLVEQRFDLWQ